MAPFKLICTSVLVLVSVHFLVLDCACVGSECHHFPRTVHCPSNCACLGPLVDCSKKGLVDLPSDLPLWTNILDLQHNNIGAIGENAFIQLNNLTQINLSNNQLQILDGAVFQNLSSLQELKLTENQLIEFPDFDNLSSLIELDVSHNEIYSLNVSILGGLPKLTILDLSFNSLVDLPADTLGNSSSLKELSLSHNRLVSIESGVFDGLQGLTHLRLSKNKLQTLPKELFRHLSALQDLELNSNSIAQIDGLSFQGLHSLVTLKLRHTGISLLQDGSFYGLSSIKRIHLDHNNIRKVTKGWLYGLNSLQRLYINNNNISEIEEDAWDSGRRLLELDISQNSLPSLPSKAFDKLYSLKRLDLSDNKIAYMEEDAFHSLSALQHLELRNNDVAWTIEDHGKVFGPLSRLRYLGLANNKIQTIVRRAFHGLSRLQTLNLTENHITNIEEGAFNDLTHLQSLHLNTSSLLCDCHLAWMTKDFQYKVHAKCGFPERLKGNPVFNVPASEMICEGGSPKPSLVKSPPGRLSALKGENVTFECQAVSTAHTMTVHWRKDGKLVSRHNTRSHHIRRGEQTLTTSILRIMGVGAGDEGRYQCVVGAAAGAAYSPPARLTVHVFPAFTRTPHDVHVRVGGTARLECGAHGHPRPSISWQKDGGGEDFPAARERRMHVMPTDDVFYIVNARAADAGIYSCTARNAAGAAMANATVAVLEAAAFARPMEPRKEVGAAETAVLECLATGSPRPTLKWTKDGSPLLVTERHFFTANNQLLIIVQASLADAGTYTCEMTNTLGSEKGSTLLKIIQVVPPGHPGSGEESQATTGVIVIAVVICIVGTSIVWVVIIYHTRRRSYTGSSKNYRSRELHSENQSKESSSNNGGSSGIQSDMLIEEEDPLVHGHLNRIPVERPEPSLSSRSSAGSREQVVPLLQTFRPPEQRSLSCERLERPPRSHLLRSTSVSECSPKFARLPKDIPNDSGSFSIAGDEEPVTSKSCAYIPASTS